MRIKYYAYLRNDAGCKEETISGPSSALALLHMLSSVHGKKLRDHLLSSDGTDLHPDLILLVDGRHVEFIGGKDYIIPEGALVSLFPRIAGG